MDDDVTIHQPHDYVLNILFRRRSKKTSKLRPTGLFVGNSPVTGEFPSQRVSDAQTVSIWWLHHVFDVCGSAGYQRNREDVTRVSSNSSQKNVDQWNTPLHMQCRLSLTWRWYKQTRVIEFRFLQLLFFIQNWNTNCLSICICHIHDHHGLLFWWPIFQPIRASNGLYILHYMPLHAPPNIRFCKA